jgi:hypothetical protein
MDIIFERKPFTDWTIIVKDRYFDKYQEVQYAKGSLDFDEFTGIFRTGAKNGKECEKFT